MAEESEQVWTRRAWLGLGLGAVLGQSGCAGGTARGSACWPSHELGRCSMELQKVGAKGYGIWDNGHLVASRDVGQSGPALSITKVMASIAVAKGMSEGWIHLEEPVAHTITEWKGDPRRQRITISMLLQQVAGLDAGSHALYRSSIPDKGAVAIRLPLVSEPGTQFRYGAACWEVLAEVLQRKLQGKGENLERFMARAVMGPVGIHSSKWRSDAKGRYYLSTGVEPSVANLGNLGNAVAAWINGRSAAGISAAHFQEATRPSAANVMFGGGLWYNRNAARSGSRRVEIEEVLDPPRSPSFWRSVCLSKNQPAGMVAMIGSSGQRIYVWPDGRVIARLGRGKWKDGRVL